MVGDGTLMEGGELSASLRRPFDLFRDGVVRGGTNSRVDRRREVSNRSSSGTFELRPAAVFEFESVRRDPLAGQNGELAPEHGFEP